MGTSCCSIVRKCLVFSLVCWISVALLLDRLILRLSEWGDSTRCKRIRYKHVQINLICAASQVCTDPSPNARQSLASQIPEIQHTPSSIRGSQWPSPLPQTEIHTAQVSPTSEHSLKSRKLLIQQKCPYCEPGSPIQAPSLQLPFPTTPGSTGSVKASGGV